MILKGKIDILVPKPHEQIALEKTLMISNRTPPDSPDLKWKVQRYVKAISPFILALKQNKTRSPASDFLFKSPNNQKFQSPKQNPKKTSNFKRQKTDDFENISPNFKSSDLKGNLTDFYDEKVFKYYVTRSLEEGNGFGEIPFNVDRARTFTTICSEDCWLGVIERKDYMQIFREIRKIKIQEKLVFFGKCFFLNVLEKETWKIYNYYFLFQKDKIKKNAEIYAKGEEISQIFFIKKGEIEIFDQNEGEFKVKVALLGKGQIFGEEYVVNLTERRFSAVCHSQTATLFSLNQSFLQQILYENPEFQVIFKQMALKRSNFRENKLLTFSDLTTKPAKIQKSSIKDPKFFTVRATEEDIDRYVNAGAILTEVSAVNSQINTKETLESEIKVKVKAFEDKSNKKNCFLRAKRMYQQKKDGGGTAQSVYEIDNSEKNMKDRGDDTNYLREIIRNNEKCYKVLNKRSKKFTRDEILQIFDKEKLEILENRKRLKKKYGERNKDSSKENSKENPHVGHYGQLFDEALESQKRKKGKARCRSAINFYHNKENDNNSLEIFNDKGEVKVNFHIKVTTPVKVRPITGRPVSGGYVIVNNTGGKGKKEEKSSEKFYEKIQEFLIKGRSVFGNSSLKKKNN